MIAAFLANGLRMREGFFELDGRVLGDQAMGRLDITLRSNSRAGIDLQTTRANNAGKFEPRLRRVHAGPSHQV